MKAQTSIAILAAAVLAFAAGSAAAQGQGQGQQGKGAATPPERAQVERGQRDYDSDRSRDRARVEPPSQDRNQDQSQDRTQAPDSAPQEAQGIYGGELMSTQEKNQYREQLRLTESDPEARNRFMAQHREEMQKRAKEQGKEIKDPSKNGESGTCLERL